MRPQSKIVRVQFIGQKGKQAHKVRPCTVFLEEALQRVSTVEVTSTMAATLRDTQFVETRGEEVKAPVAESDDLFGEVPVTRVRKKTVLKSVSNPTTPTPAPDATMADFNAWLEMGKNTFGMLPQRVEKLPG